MKLVIGGQFKTAKGTYQIAAFQGIITDQFGQRHQIGEVDLMVGPPVFRPEEKRDVRTIELQDKIHEIEAASREGSIELNEWESEFVANQFERSQRFGSKLELSPKQAQHIEDIHEKIGR